MRQFTGEQVQEITGFEINSPVHAGLMAMMRDPKWLEGQKNPEERIGLEATTLSRMLQVLTQATGHYYATQVTNARLAAHHQKGLQSSSLQGWLPERKREYGTILLNRDHYLNLLTSTTAGIIRFCGSDAPFTLPSLTIFNAGAATTRLTQQHFAVDAATAMFFDVQFPSNQPDSVNLSPLPTFHQSVAITRQLPK